MMQLQILRLYSGGNHNMGISVESRTSYGIKIIQEIGETQKCIIENHYETFPGYKGEENIQDDKQKN